MHEAINPSFLGTPLQGTPGKASRRSVVPSRDGVEDEQPQGFGSVSQSQDILQELDPEHKRVA
jgi:hypothetical protein